MELAKYAYKTDRLYRDTRQDLFSHRRIIDYLYHENLHLRSRNMRTRHVFLTEAEAYELEDILDVFCECYARMVDAQNAGYEGESDTPSISNLDGLEARIARALDGLQSHGVGWLYDLDPTVQVPHTNSYDLPIPTIRGIPNIPFLMICRYDNLLQLGAIITEGDPVLETAMQILGIHVLLLEEEMDITKSVTRFHREMGTANHRVCHSDTELSPDKTQCKDYEKNRVIWCKYVNPLQSGEGDYHPDTWDRMQRTLERTVKTKLKPEPAASTVRDDIFHRIMSDKRRQRDYHKRSVDNSIVEFVRPKTKR